MIIPDVNVLVYAYNANAREHAAVKAWWKDALDGHRPIGLPWAVTMGYVRVITNRSVQRAPFTPAQALADVRSWLALDNVQIVDPGPRHLEIVGRLLDEVGVGGNLVTDAHLAALAIENQAELCSTDADFSRFKGLRWTNPLA